MTGQPTLDGRPPPDGGLWARVRNGNQVDHAAWLRAHAARQPVGTCRVCGDDLYPQRAYEHSGRVDYTATCRACGAEMVAPGGRLNTGQRRRKDVA